MAWPAILLRARSLARANRAATAFLALLVGLSAGAVMFAAAAARRSDTAVERYLAAYRTTDVLVFTCPDTVGPEIFGDYESLIRMCFDDIQTGSDTAELAGLAGVEAVNRFGLNIVGVADARSPIGWFPQLLYTKADPGIPADGTPVVLAGRMYRDDAPDEVVVNEKFLNDNGFRLGDVLTVAAFTVDQFTVTSDNAATPDGLAHPVTIVGIVRHPEDLKPTSDNSNMYPGPAWWAAHGPDVARYALEPVVRLADGPSAVAAFDSAVRQLWPDRQLIDIPPLVDTDVASTERATGLEAGTWWMLAGLLALAALVASGVTAARQIGRELGDQAAVHAIGGRRIESAWTAVVRAGPLALAASGIAGLAAVLASDSSPIGVARRAEVDPGIRADAPVLAIGMAAVPVLVLALTFSCGFGRRAASSGVAGHRAPPPRRGIGSARRTRTLPAGFGPRSASRALGDALGSGRRERSARWSAIAAVASGIAVAVLVGTLVRTLDGVTDHPERYGVTWDARVGNVADLEQARAFSDQAASNPVVAATALVYSETATLDHREVPMLVFDGDGRIGPTVVEGRVPTALGEVAVGRNTLEELGARVGDTVEMAIDPFGPTPTDPLDVRIVGWAILNDSADVAAGRGFVVSAATLHAFAPTLTPEGVAMRLDPELDHDTALRALSDEFPFSTELPVAQNDLLNVQRVRDLPLTLAIAVGALSLAVLIHAVVTTLRRNRRDLAVFRALGGTRHQTRAGLAWYLTAIAFPALITGSTAGWVLGRWGWSALVAYLGLASGPVVPWSVLALVVVALAGAAGLLALASGWRAVRTTPAQALRGE